MDGAKARLLLACAALVVGLAVSLWLGRLSPRPAQHKAAAVEASSSDTRPYRRIICMSPAATEVAFALDAADLVVGVSEHTKHPPEALAKPTCGGFINPNYELILSLEADLVVTQGRAEALTRFGRDNRLAVVSLELGDLESIFREAEKLGRIIGAEPEADLLCAEMRYRLAQVRAAVSRQRPVSVLLVTGREPGSLNDISAVGPGSFLHDLVEVAGGRNVFSDLGSSGAVVNKEAVLERAPEVVVELRGEGGDTAAREAEARRLWGSLASLPAVRNGRVHVVEATYALIPGPRVVLLAEKLASLLHPEGR